jgi:virginiamycin A acetyltransferase
VRRQLKILVRAILAVIVFPLALLAAFGRFGSVYVLFAQTLALVPGIIGDSLRTAFYFLTLEHCSLLANVGFGSYFAHAQTRVAEGVDIGAYCVLGRAVIGERTRLASGVQILSGMNQHARDAQGRLVPGDFTRISIGSDCWIGAGAIVMADVGDRATISAGAVVMTPIAAGTVATGNPARSVRPAHAV